MYKERQSPEKITEFILFPTSPTQVVPEMVKSKILYQIQSGILLGWFTICALDQVKFDTYVSDTYLFAYGPPVKASI